VNSSASRRLRIWIVLAIALLACLILYALFRTPAPWARRLVRAAALFGYSSIFLTILSHEYMRDMKRLFGQTFLKVHHVLAVVGLVLIVLHPLTLALLTQNPSVFVPRFDSLDLFLTLGGRPALYLFLIAVLAALLRRRIRNVWRFVHWLNYVAFGLAFVHGLRMGPDASQGLLALVWVAMFAVVLLVFLRKRLGRRGAVRG